MRRTLARMSCLVVLVLPALARGGGVYDVRRLSEQEMLTRYRDVLRDGCRYAERDWHQSTFDPAAAGYWGDGVSGGNQGIRTVGSMVLACATLLKYDDSLADAQRAELLAKATAGLRYAAATHRTGDQRCTDGKPWGAIASFGPESWQSGMWTGTLAFGAWLMWDRLDPALREDVQQVVAWEADVLSPRKPPTGASLNTRAEENGWEVPCLTLAGLMFPTHPHAAQWRETSLRYMMNTLCTEADARDDTLIDGRAVSEWVGGANLHPDFTLENHNAFHPSYVGCSSYFLTQAQMYYAFGSQPAPQAASHHLGDTWRMFRSVILPWGESAYPQGMDWELHGLTFINLYAALATREKDAFAARMEQSILQYIGAWQRMGEGSLAFPGSRLGITRHAINCEQVSYAFLAHHLFGPAVEPLGGAAAASQERGVRDYPYVGFIAHRSEKKFVSFSWKNRVMGMLIPIGDGHDDNPAFATPQPHGFIGSFDLAPRGDAGDAKVQVVDHFSKPGADGFETGGTLLRNGGRLKQTLRLVSVGGQSVVYEDRVTALADVTVEAERGVPLGIENDEITGGVRRVTDRDHENTFEWKSPRPQPVALAGSWANVDGRLGMVTLSGSGMSYAQAPGYASGIAVCSDTLYGSFSARPREFKAGDDVARRLAICLVEVTPRETSAVAESCRVETPPSGRTLYFKQPDGTDVAVKLLD